MNKEQLEIAQKIAVIEGFTLMKCAGYVLTREEGSYNPYKWKILGPLIHKYEVELEHGNFIGPDSNKKGSASVFRNSKFNCKYIYTIFTDEASMKQAILESIIKSKEEPEEGDYEL